MGFDPVRCLIPLPLAGVAVSLASPGCRGEEHRRFLLLWLRLGTPLRFKQTRKTCVETSQAVS